MLKLWVKNPNAYCAPTGISSFVFLVRGRFTQRSSIFILFRYTY